MPPFWSLNPITKFYSLNLICNALLCFFVAHHFYAMNFFSFDSPRIRNCDVHKKPSRIKIISDLDDSFWLAVLYIFCCNSVNSLSLNDLKTKKIRKIRNMMWRRRNAMKINEIKIQIENHQNSLYEIWLIPSFFLFLVLIEEEHINLNALESRNDRNGYSIFTDKLKPKQLTLFFSLLLPVCVCLFLCNSFLFYFTWFPLNASHRRKQMCCFVCMHCCSNWYMFAWLPACAHSIQ